MKRAFLLLLALSLLGCRDNIMVAPPPPEADPQFVLERKTILPGGSVIFVVRDKVNNKLIYVTPGSGVKVEKED